MNAPFHFPDPLPPSAGEVFGTAGNDAGTLSLPDRDEHPARAVRAMIAASVRLYRDGLAESLRGAVQVVAVTADAQSTLAEAQRLAPDVLLVDISVDGGLALVRALGEAVPGVRVLAFGVDDARDDQVLACVETGVAGWVSRDASAAEVVDAVLRASRGELLCSARTAALLTRRVAALARERRAPAPTAAQLTPREAQVAELLCNGVSNKHIAHALGLRLATVKNHVHSILEKLEVRSRGEAGARLRATASGR